MRRFVYATLVTAVTVGLILGASPAIAKPFEESFYKAYYLEREKSDLQAAAKLYGEVASASGVEAGIKAEAQARLASVREEIATTDFARLMPPDTMVYVEISRPGDQINRLLDMLGLLAGPNQSKPDPADEISKAAAGKHVVISPGLVKGMLGIRGAAVAVTGFDPAAAMPAGVAIFHPGDLDVVRGLIESGLPAAAKATKPIEGFATYHIKEANIFICLTSRLVIVSPQRPQIVAVIKRMNGEGDSLASNPAMAEVMKQRGDSLLFYCVNAKPIVPMIAGLANGSKDMAMAQAVLDLNSLNWLSGRAGVGEHGLFFDMGVGLDKGHHNLAYNMMRTPPVTKETLKCIPKGAAGFLAGALGNPNSSASPTAKKDGSTSIVGLDFGREIFANIVDFAVFALPPAGDGRSEADAGPAPDVAAVIRVNDPAKSEALWTQILGIASLGAGAPSTDGTVEQIAGVGVRAYKFPEGGVTIYFANVGDKVLVSGSRYAISRAVEAARGGESILTDEAFAASLTRMGEHTSKALFAHPGRCFQMARKYMSESDIKEAEPVVGLMTQTVACVLTNESEETFQVSASVTGLPKVGGLVAHLIQEEGRKEQRQTALRDALRGKQWDKALEIVDAAIAENPADLERHRRKFDILAVQKKDRAAALACADVFMERAGGNARALNALAWNLLTESDYQSQYNDLALKIAEKASALTDHGDWMIVDTLARAKFETGDVDAAIELQKKAIELEGGQRQDVKEALARFEAAKKSGPTAMGE